MKSKRRVTTSRHVRPAMSTRIPMDRKRRGPRPASLGRPTGAAVEPRLPAPAPPAAEPDLSVDLGRGLVLANPILVASGTFGYGIEYGDVVEVQRLGAICCKGTTLRPRIGNVTPRVTETPGGMLNSIGLQNPGVDAVIEKYADTWTGWKVPVIVNVAGESVEDYVEVARRLDGVPGVAGIELNISCPNVGRGGLQFAIDAAAAGEVTAAVRRATDLPLLVKLSPNVADVRPDRAGDRRRRRRRADRDQHAERHRGRAVPPEAAARQHLRRPVGAGDQAGRAADRLRGRPGRRHPDRRDRRRHGARGRPRLPRGRRGRGPGRHGDLRRPDAPGPARRRARRGVPPPRAEQPSRARRDGVAAQARRAVGEGRRVPAVTLHSTR